MPGRRALQSVVPAAFVVIFSGTVDPLHGQNVEFVRGDVNQNGRLEISDAVSILRFLFQGDSRAGRCLDAADVDNTRGVQLTDAVVLLNYLFLGGRPPRAPFPDCGFDPIPDVLTCKEYAPCVMPPGGTRFYGQRFDVVDTGIYFVVDRSGSMQHTGELSRAKRELIDFMERLAESSRFAVIFVDADVRKFPADGPALAPTMENLAAASAWISEIAGGVGSCPLAGFLEALAFLEGSPVQRHLIVYLGDGGGTCRIVNEQQYLEQTLQSVTQANDGRARIHTIGVLMQHRVLQASFLRQLAAANGGRYRRIN